MKGTSFAWFFYKGKRNPHVGSSKPNLAVSSCIVTHDLEPQDKQCLVNEKVVLQIRRRVSIDVGQVQETGADTRLRELKLEKCH